MAIFSKIRGFLGRAKRDERGSLTVEYVLIFPLLVWTVTGTYSFFDGFRQSAANLKAAYTIGDLISRESYSLTDTYFKSLFILMDRMVGNESQLEMRVTVIRYDEEDKRHYVMGNTRCGFTANWENGSIGQLKDSLPPMPDQDTLILVETRNRYVPTFNISWLADDYTFDNFVFTRPRFNDKVAWAASDQFCQQTVPTV